MRISRSETATTWQPRIRRNCSMCASAILPHPTMATLSMVAFLAAAFKKAPQALLRGYPGNPAQPTLQFLVAVTRAFPEGAPFVPRKHRRELSLRPGGIRFPEPAQKVTH